jgi:hypothetical protein
LVSSEIRKREEKAADQARPKRVALVRVDREIDRLEFSHFTGDRERVFEREIRREPVNRDRKCNGHAD